MSYEQFGKLNMKQIKIIANAYTVKLEEDFRLADVMAYVQGRYMVDALLCTVGNMLGGKKVSFSYPEQAYTMAKQEKDLTEEEIQQQREQFIAALQTMERNFKLDKNRKKG